ncbi:MAG: peptide MFS transporter [Bacteroidales bacterium]|nr:peptide MFS transporter [Candidatus Cryptobacteroides faecihippi]
MFKGQPKGLYALALANTGERFGYYTMLAVFSLFLGANFGLTEGQAGVIYSVFLALVYFLPLVGGILADRFGYGKMVTIGIIVMFLGYLVMSIPMGGDRIALAVMGLALLLISMGTGLFKGNLQVMVGNLYDDPEYESRRDSGFSLFYMAINVGAMFAPTAAIKIKAWAESIGFSSNDAYHFSFAVACAALVLSIGIYYAFRSTFKHVEGGQKKADAASSAAVKELSPEETKSRIVALCLVFAVVIFFWMAFQQNGLTLTFFADQFTAKSSTGIQAMSFDVVNLIMLIVIVYGGFMIHDSKTAKGKGTAIAAIVAAIAVLIWKYTRLDGPVEISAPIFQHFNACFVIALTPVSIALFGSMAKKGKEPSAPRKIALGMLVAAIAYLVMVIGSLGLNTPDAQKLAGEAGTFASPNWLISTYLILTFGELLLSPMGISFVSKVAPPKYKGMMMGGWFVATAAGNLLVQIGGYLWGPLPVWVVWAVFMVLCLLSAGFMFAMMKRIESATD